MRPRSSLRASCRCWRLDGEWICFLLFFISFCSRDRRSRCVVCLLLLLAADADADAGADADTAGQKLSHVRVRILDGRRVPFMQGSCVLESWISMEERLLDPGLSIRSLHLQQGQKQEQERWRRGIG
jgi:hypothetical protein